MDPTGLVDKFRDLVLNLIWEQLLYLIYYHRNIDQFNEQLMELSRARSSVQHQIDEAKNNGEQIEEEVLHWLGEGDELSEQVEKFHEESRAKPECSITSCPNPWLRYKLSKRAKAMTEEGAKIYAKRNFDRISYRKPLPSMLELTNREGNEGIDSRIPIINQILEELKNPGVNMIGLCGLGGVGKTTIAKEVAKNQKIFEKVIMATVSQELNIEKIQGQIAEKLSMQLNENNKEVRAFRLRERLEEEKNMLLILDDLWEELDLGKVGIPFVENYSKKNEGCKILLTSRKKELLSDLMKCQKIVEVGVLSEYEALELFKKIAELSTDSSSTELISIAFDIVRKCGGLPLAIATAAKTLRNKDLNEFEDALARLNNPLRRNTTLTREVDLILKLSYDHLESSEYKHIFLLAAMLSHDPSIEDLIMYSVGLDVLGGIQNMEEAHAGISTAVRKLKSSNLFLDSISSHHVTIHDVFRDVAWPIASDELHAFIRRRLREWPDENTLQGCKGICLQESDISDLPEELHGPRLKFFLLNSTRCDLNIPITFFESLVELNVLAFTNVHFSSLSSFVFLQKLKALCLHSCFLEDVTEIRSLKNVKVLSLAYSEIERLPIELAELTSLQMLNLSHCSNLKEIPQKLLSSLKKLEVLHMGNSFHQWKVEGSNEANENASLGELKGLPISSLDIHIPNVSMLQEKLFLDMNMKRYKIFIGKKWEWQDNYEASKILKLQLQSSIHLKGGVQKLLEGVDDLYLYGFNAHENVLHNHEGRRFLHLRHLQIDGNYGIRSEAATKNVSNKTFKSLFGQKVLLPQLKILKLSNLNCLVPLIWDGQLSHNSFSNLKTLVVKSCGFVKLVPLHVLKSLNNLEELDVEDCDMLEKVFDFEDLNDYKVMESSSVAVPLKKLKLGKLPKLKNVWSDHYQGNVCFPSLRSVNVCNCKSLTSIFPASIAKGMLCDLEELQIRQCGVVVIVTKDPVSESGAVTFGFLRLTTLLLSDLPNLRNFYPQKHTLEWPHLNQISIHCCDQLEIFGKEVSCSSEIYEEENILDSKYPLLPHDKVIGNLERFTLQGKEVETIGSGQFLMYHFPKLKLLHLSLEKQSPFPHVQLWEMSPNLGELKLSGDFEKVLGSDNVAALAAFFPKLTLERISIMGSLSPSLVSSPNLIHLNVTGCNEWTTLMTSSTARSLVHLTRLSVGDCFQMEEIITKQEGEDDEKPEIIFIKLKFLELERLPRLKRFCAHNYNFKFLLLDQLIIKECPKFKIFSPGLIETPSLKSIQLWEDWKKHHEIWDTDLNNTFYRQLLMVSREVVLDEDDARMIRNDQFPADCCPQVEILHIKGFGEKWVTFPYTLLERFPELNKIHVENCSFEVIFPSQAPSSTSFHNLTVLKVSKCHQLVYLVTCSTAKSLVNLETLEIDDCERLEEIVRNETEEDVEGGVTFNGLRILKLTHLPRLKTQEDERDFNIEDQATNTEYTNISRSPFRQKKVLLPKLETLELSNLVNNSVSFIWNDQLLHNSFNNVKTLIVRRCDFMKSVPLLVLKSLTNLEKLEVSYCDRLEKVFGFEDLNEYHKEMESSSVVAPLSLTHLEVKGCRGLTTLMTSSAAPSLVHITHLSISYCDQIEEIIMKQEGEDDEDKEIIFNKMKFLKLDNLPRLKRFCRHNYTFRFPLLDKLVITRCPKLKSFSPGLIDTPSLSSLHLSQDWGEHHEIWDTNLNKTFCQQLYVTSRELVLDDEDDAKMIRNDQFPADCCPQVEILHIKGFVEEWVTFPYTLLERFPKLNKLHVENCSFEEIFPSHVPSSTSFHNLTVLKVSKCHQLVYLMACSTVKSLVNLETLEVDDCEKMEEIVRHETDEDVERGIIFNGLRILKLNHLPKLKTREDEKDFNIEDRATNTRCTSIFRSLFSHNKVLLPQLKILELSNLNSLIPLIYDDQLSHNSFSNLKTLVVKSCGFVKLVPLHVLKSLNNLEELDVEDCDMLEKVFDFEDLNDYKVMESSSVAVPLKKLKLGKLPKLKNVWSDHYQGNVCFPSLRSVNVCNCKSLTSIFPASIAKGMLCDLEELQIRQCGVDVIVTKDPVSESGAVTFGFLRLTTLLLSDLPNLRNFYPQKHTLEWPHLNQISIHCCDQLEIFGKEVSCSSEIYEEENILDSKYPLLPHGKVIGNLERFTLQGKEVETIGSGQFLMYHFPKLKLLHLSLEKQSPFPHVQLWEMSPNLGELKLSGDFEKALGSDNVAALAARFPKLTLERISIMGRLSPSLVSSPNLTHLNVTGCNEWTTLMTSSTARSLVHLTRLSVADCFQMEEIITKQEGEDDEKPEIIFIKLKFLELERLPRLKRFCAHNYNFKFLLLDQLIIKECPKFKIFSTGLIETPSLKSIQLWEDWKKHHEIWDTDLNNTFYRQLLMVSREVVLDEDDARMIRNDQFPADYCPQVEILHIKGFGKEWVTFPYTLLERFPELNKIHVENCSFEVIFPSQAPSSTSFHNLTVLKVSKCHQLVYFVTCSTAKSLVHLETLEIDDCERLEEIVRNETEEDVEGGVTFNGLRILKLTRLPKLKTQEDERDFNIEDQATNTKYPNISRSPFRQKKVLLPKLETLELSNLVNNSVSFIWHDQLLHNSFNNVKTLIVRSCDFMKSVPLLVLKSLTNLENLEVSYCDRLEKVFGFEDLNEYRKEMESSSVVAPLSLTHLEVKGCRGLTTLMMSSAAPSLVHITHLSISYCDQIEEIIMKQEGEDDEDKEIIFNKMKFLKLDNLPRLKRFCRHNYTFRFPLLDKLVITRCPKLKSFSPGLIDTPSLSSLHLSQDWGEHHEIWDTNLNKTFCQQLYVTSRELVLDDEDDAKMIRNDQFPADCCPQLEILHIKGFVEEWVTFPYTLLERFPKLNKLHVENCSFEEIFPSHVPSSTSFHNLTVLKVSKCHQLVYLMACSTVKSLVNLETLEVDDCEKMEEIVRHETDEDVERGIIFNGLRILKLTHLPKLKTREDEKDFNIEDRATNTRCTSIFRSLFSHNKVLLPKLKILELSNLNSLIPLIYDDQLSHNSFSNLKTLIVKSCGFVKLVSLHVLKSLNNLEELDVEDCDMLEKVFDFEDLNDYKEMESSSVVVPLKKLKLRKLPKLKNVWSDHYQGNVCFPSLRSVDVYNCKSLTSVFPASIAKGMLCDLEELQIRQCGVDVIVTKDPVSESGAVTFGFLRLTTLLLSDLPNLRNFYPQKHTLEWPHLNQISIHCCDQLEIFGKEVSCSSEIYEEENILDSKYPLLPHDKVIGNLERFTLQGKEVETIGSGQFLMYHFPKLKLLHLSLEKQSPFPHVQLWEMSPNLGELKLSGDFEKALGSDNVAALAARFPKLTLERISIMGTLSPSLVTSPNLTHLSVTGCNEWTTLITSSTARSLVHLTRLSVGDCFEMEEIITKQEGEDDENKEIIFIKLKVLELERLPRLKRFCAHNYNFKFLLLDQLSIKECPKFKIFSPALIETPSLKSIQLGEDWEKHHEILDTDLNNTIYRQFLMVSREVVLDEDDARMIRNDQFPADCCPQVEILHIKGFGEEWVTFPYTLLERFPELNKIHVENCSFEVIFPSKAPSSTSFHNLTVLKVSKCHQLVYLVTCSIAKSLVNLETLEIHDCERLEEIVRNEIEEDVEGGVTFNGLRILKLTRLPRLKRQEDERDFNIEDQATNTEYTNISRSLFRQKKVLLPKLETLELSN